MIGAIIGDIVGSRFEFDNCKSKDFEMFDKDKEKRLRAVKIATAINSIEGVPPTSHEYIEDK